MITPVTVKHTIIENTYVHIGSAILQSGLKYIIIEAMTTPIDIIISPRTCRKAASILIFLRSFFSVEWSQVWFSSLFNLMLTYFKLSECFSESLWSCLWSCLPLHFSPSIWLCLSSCLSSSWWTCLWGVFSCLCYWLSFYSWECECECEWWWWWWELPPGW